MRAAILLCGAALLSACSKPPASAPAAEAAFKLECRREGTLLVFILDPKTQVVTIGNIGTQPKGTFTTTPYEYYMRFQRGERMEANDARVNRYDGEMEREFGKPPFLTTHEIFVKDGNVLQVWKCKRAEAKPIL